MQIFPVPVRLYIERVHRKLTLQLCLRRLCLFLYFLDTAFDGFQVFQLKFVINDFFVADGIYASVYVCHIVVIEATEYVDNCVCFTDIGKELVS